MNKIRGYPEFRYHRWEWVDGGEEHKQYNREVDEYNTRVAEVMKEIDQLKSCSDSLEFEGVMYQKPHNMQITHCCTSSSDEGSPVEYLGRVYDEDGQREAVLGKLRGVDGDREFLGLCDRYFCPGCDQQILLAVGLSTATRDRLFTRKCTCCGIESWDLDASRSCARAASSSSS